MIWESLKPGTVFLFDKSSLSDDEVKEVVVA